MTQHHYTPSHFLKLALFLHFYSLTNLQLSFFFYNIKPFSWLMPHYATVHLTYSKGKTHLHPPLTSASTSGCQTRFILIVYFLSSFYCVEMISFSFVWMSFCVQHNKNAEPFQILLTSRVSNTSIKPHQANYITVF